MLSTCPPLSPVASSCLHRRLCRLCRARESMLQRRHPRYDLVLSRVSAYRDRGCRMSWRMREDLEEWWDENDSPADSIKLLTCRRPGWRLRRSRTTNGRRRESITARQRRMCRSSIRITRCARRRRKSVPLYLWFIHTTVRTLVRRSGTRTAATIRHRKLICLRTSTTSR